MEFYFIFHFPDQSDIQQLEDSSLGLQVKGKGTLHSRNVDTFQTLPRHILTAS
jgi:hypothetical protein